MITGEAARRLIALLRIVERTTVQDSVAYDDAMLDAWFGPHARALPADH
jgi:hypothetical protein